jgi:hypothetical protein
MSGFTTEPTFGWTDIPSPQELATVSSHEVR